MRATVTGVDSGGRLFRDTVPIVFLKARKCTYQSKYKPSLQAEVMVEIQEAKETWRSDAKVQQVLPAPDEQNAYRVTIELDRAHTAVIEPPEPEKAPAGTPSPESKDS